MSEAFWHPVMGAVDFMAQNIVDARKRKHEEELRQQEIQQKRQFEVEDRDIQRKEQEQQRRMGWLQQYAENPNIRPEDRQSAMQAQIKEGTLPIESPQLTMRPLRPEVAKAFEGYIDTKKLYPLDQASKFEEDYYKKMKDLRDTRNTESMIKLRGKQGEAAIIRANKYKTTTGPASNASITGIIQSFLQEAEEYKKEKGADENVDKYISTMYNMYRKAKAGQITQQDVDKLKSLPETMATEDEFQAETGGILDILGKLNKKLGEIK